jgi:ankyrin repeat protein
MFPISGLHVRVVFLTFCSFLVLAAVGCGNQQPAEKHKSVNPVSDPRPKISPGEVSEENALTEAKSALTRGGSPHDIVEPEYGLTRIHVAARSGHVKLLKYLIDQGGNVDVENTGGAGTGGETPLHWASTAEVVDLLLAEGADPNRLGAAGQPPLASMALRNRLSALDQLIKHGADVNARDTHPFFGLSVLHWACTGLVADYGEPALNRYKDRIAIIEHLVAHGAKVNAQDNNGETPLHIAAKYNAQFVALLLRLGAKPSVKDKKGKLPIDWSKELGQDESIALLEKVSKR